ncbi:MULTISPECIES: AAA family ATPase [Thermoactinomyces]|uniref:AAA family ATPase n=1 Tax=Thermoactinomyces daqus TaxID=1329516 RepID=A0A7W1XBB7_9BACL|nr:MULTISPECIES: AAA family ATPase [Thermoactinomyces]MBA4543427.1 AAA family ATPase [Thermoactinomyces daqus]MBH8606020.1 AAA family ATPase [Thermoactinomyces sp. CICC 10521]
MFQPAKKVKKSLKIAVYGEPGTGKTWFGLMAPGRKAVIDTENGTDFYGERFEFDVLKTRLYSEVRQALDYIEQNPGQYDVLIVDPITNIYQVLKDAAQMNAENRARRNKKNPDDAALTFRDWGIVKNKYNSLISRLCNLPCHVVITGWLKDIYEGEGENMKKVGSRIDADKKTEYQPDVIIKLEVDKNGNRYGVIEKDRTMTYKKGQKVKDISFESFLGAVNKVGTVSRLMTEEEAATAEAEITVETLEKIKDKWLKSGKAPQELTVHLKQTYAAKDIYSLTEKQGQEVLKWIAGGGADGKRETA